LKHLVAKKGQTSVDEYQCGFCNRTFYVPDKEPYPPERCPWCGSTSEVDRKEHKTDNNIDIEKNEDSYLVYAGNQYVGYLDFTPEPSLCFCMPLPIQQQIDVLTKLNQNLENRINKCIKRKHNDT
jgi:DNA-directed RNA polymerase subunit RPC12/RpoP